jgi:hypothetical protein
MSGFSDLTDLRNPTLLSTQGLLYGCPLASSGRVVTVGPGYIQLGNVAVPVAGGTITVPAADPSKDRYDGIAVDIFGKLQVVIGTPGQPFSMTDPTLTLIGTTLLLAGTSSISAIAPVALLATNYVDRWPAQTFAYTYVGSGLANADPGPGNFGFNGLNNIGGTPITSMYVSLTNAVGAAPGHTVVSLANAFAEWLNQAVTVAPFYLRLWSRQSPTNWYLCKVVSSFAHSTYYEVNIVFVRQSAPAINGPTLFTDLMDTIFEFAGFTTTGSLIKRTTYTTVTSGTHTFDPSCTKARITLVGSGGGGGGASTNVGINSGSAGGGGGGGGVLEADISVVSSTASWVIGSNGAGGAGGTTGGNGSDGADVTFTHNSITYTAGKGFGGGGGGTGVTGVSISNAAPGDGGTCTGGDLNMKGDPGQESIYNGNKAVSGDGGGNPRGGGGISQLLSAQGATAGAIGGNYGAGGSGAVACRVAGGNQGANGGNGQVGIIIVDEYT